ncbi:unnamed protein product [Amoebophrya sp. A25]|nr:unnamed protein product [Amoebophrya sp. A25]|eukprot:GSA25T00018779001.1
MIERRLFLSGSQLAAEGTATTSSGSATSSSSVERGRSSLQHAQDSRDEAGNTQNKFMKNHLNDAALFRKDKMSGRDRGSGTSSLEGPLTHLPQSCRSFGPDKRHSKPHYVGQKQLGEEREGEEPSCLSEDESVDLAVASGDAGFLPQSSSRKDRNNVRLRGGARGAEGEAIPFLIDDAAESGETNEIYGRRRGNSKEFLRSASLNSLSSAELAGLEVISLAPSENLGGASTATTPVGDDRPRPLMSTALATSSNIVRTRGTSSTSNGGTANSVAPDTDRAKRPKALATLLDNPNTALQVPRSHNLNAKGGGLKIATGADALLVDGGTHSPKKNANAGSADESQATTGTSSTSGRDPNSYSKEDTATAAAKKRSINGAGGDMKGQIYGDQMETGTSGHGQMKTGGSTADHNVKQESLRVRFRRKRRSCLLWLLQEDPVSEDMHRTVSRVKVPQSKRGNNKDHGNYIYNMTRTNGNVDSQTNMNGAAAGGGINSYICGGGGGASTMMLPNGRTVGHLGAPGGNNSSPGGAALIIPTGTSSSSPVVGQFAQFSRKFSEVTNMSSSERTPSGSVSRTILAWNRDEENQLEGTAPVVSFEPVSIEVGGDGLEGGQLPRREGSGAGMNSPTEGSLSLSSARKMGSANFDPLNINTNCNMGQNSHPGGGGGAVGKFKNSGTSAGDGDLRFLNVGGQMNNTTSFVSGQYNSNEVVVNVTGSAYSVPASPSSKKSPFALSKSPGLLVLAGFEDGEEASNNPPRRSTSRDSRGG